MDDVTQIRVGGQMVGLVGLKAALVDAADQCRGVADEQVAQILLERLAKRNYIPKAVAARYQEAFLREYKRHIGAPAADTPAEGVEIKVLGPGCPQCERLDQEVMAVLAESGIAAELTHVRDPAEIGRYGVMGTPALVVNGSVKAVGAVPLRAKLKSWIEAAATQHNPTGGK
ncbi:MAG: thioredoxin family protein [Desulfobacterales bacterium]